MHCGARRPGLFGFSLALRDLGRDFGFAPLVIAVCVVVYLAQLVVDPSALRQGGLLSLFGPSRCVSFLFGASGGLPVFGYDRFWTILSAGWLHGGLLHIGLNLYWLRQLAPQVATLYGPGRSISIDLLGSAAGFATTTVLSLVRLPLVHGSNMTVGASAALCGWLGALLYYGHRTGQRRVSRDMLWGLVAPFILIGFLLPGIDNWAHIGGFAGGYGAARLLDPLRPERTNHVVMALVLLAASLLAVVWSIVHGLPLRAELGC